MSNGTTIIAENDRFKVAHWRRKLYLIDKTDKGRPYVYFTLLGGREADKKGIAKRMLERGEKWAEEASQSCHGDSVTESGHDKRKEVVHG